MTGRVLGIDPGTRRIGVALSDPQRLIASPHATLDARGDELDAKQIMDLAAEHEVSEIVVGYPRNMDGTPGPAAEAAQALAERLRASGADVRMWDERLSSVQAERAMIAQGARRSKRREATDRVAAAIVLQSYLDSRRSGS